MTDRPEVVIVGGGVVGACTAFELVERGVRTLLLERGDICSGASYGNAGWVFASLSAPLPAPGVIRHALPWLLDVESPLYIKPRLSLELLRWLWRFRAACRADATRAGFELRRALALASLERHAALAKLDAIAGDFCQRGLLMAYRSEQALREAQTEIDWLDARGGGARWLTTHDLRARIPALAANLAGGIEFPMDAHLRPDTFVRSLIAAAEQRGLLVHRNTEVIGLEWSRRAPVRVQTTRGDFTADELILAAGAYTTELARQVGLRVPIQAAKGYSITVERPDQHPDLPVMLAEAHVAVTPFEDTLRFAGTLELGGLDLRIDMRRVEALRRAVRTYLPGLEATPMREIWRGLRPMTPDDLPILGRPKGSSGLILASGHGMDGMALGPISGELIAQLAAGEAPRFDLAPFSPDRF
jgi:D-amino-acid dehydrogenase